MTTRPEGRVVFLQMKLCRRKSEKRADRVVRPYMVRRKIGGTGGQSRPPLQGTAENRRNGRTGASAPTWCGGKSEERADRGVRPYKVQKKIAEAGGRGAVRGSLRKIHEYSLVYTAKVWYSETQQWRSILVGPTGIGEGPKNPLKGISMKPVVSASYAQSGVDAGGRHFLPAADGPVPMAWEARTRPLWRPDIVQRRTPFVVSDLCTVPD